jgi:hypothetical protein
LRNVRRSIVTWTSPETQGGDHRDSRRGLAYHTQTSLAVCVGHAVHESKARGVRRRNELLVAGLTSYFSIFKVPSPRNWTFMRARIFEPLDMG